MQNLGPQNQALAAPLRTLFAGVRPYGHDAVPAQRVVALVELFAAARDVGLIEDAGGRRGDRLVEEGAVEHPHGAVYRRREHVGGHLIQVWRGCLVVCCCNMLATSSMPVSNVRGSVSHA